MVGVSLHTEASLFSCRNPEGLEHHDGISRPHISGCLPLTDTRVNGVQPSQLLQRELSGTDPA